MHGIHTALITPFDANGAVDIDTFERLASRQIDGGVAGLVPCGTTGETPTLTHDEWKAVLAAAVRVAGGRVPVTVGVGTYDTASTVANVEAAAELGADAGLLVFPYYNKPNPDGLRAHVRAALEPGLPLVLYHIPGRTGQLVPVDRVAELADLPGVIGIKEATGDLRYGTDLVAATETAVLSGDDFTFLGLLAQGGTGCISVVSNIAPAATVAVQDALERGEARTATARFHALLPLITYLFADSNPVNCKAALHAMGLCRPDVRLPLMTSRVATPAALIESAR